MVRAGGIAVSSLTSTRDVRMIAGWVEAECRNLSQTNVDGRGSGVGRLVVVSSGKGTLQQG
jgi:hypothetical protein